MGLTDKIRSAIQELRDQLFIETADGTNLGTTTANYGFDRPPAGVTEDQWRSVARAVAMRPKQVLQAFYDALSVLVGPQLTRIGGLRVGAVPGQKEIKLHDSSTFTPHIGTLRIDPLMTTEETVGFNFNDIPNGILTLTSELTEVHSTLFTPAATRVRVDVPEGGTVVSVHSVVDMPTAPFPIMLGRDTEREELALVTAVDTVLHELTLSTGTTYEHPSDKSGFLSAPLNNPVYAGFSFLPMAASDLRKFPPSGWVKVTPDDPDAIVALMWDDEYAVEFLDWFDLATALPFATNVAELTEYTRVDYDEGILVLPRHLINHHPTGEQVELQVLGDSVESVTVVQERAEWSVHQTSPREIQIVLEDDDTVARTQDATHIHGATHYPLPLSPFLDELPSLEIQAAFEPFETALAVDIPEAYIPGARLVAATVVGDTSIRLDDATRFPVSGVIDFEGTAESIGYAGNDQRATKLTASVTAGTVIYVASIVPFEEATTLRPIAVRIGTDIMGWVSTTVTRADAATQSLTLSNAVTRTAGAIVESSVRHTLTLLRALSSTHSVGEVVNRRADAYAATDLEDGALSWNGDYLFAPSERAPTETLTTLATKLAGPTRVLASQIAGATSLEVADASQFPTAGYPYSLRVARGTSADETVSVSDITFRNTINASPVTVSTAASLGDTEVEANGGTAAYPESSLTGTDARYRILVGYGTANAEVCRVSFHTPDTPGVGSPKNTFFLMEPLVRNHAIGETVLLLADVITTSALARNHEGLRSDSDVPLDEPKDPVGQPDLPLNTIFVQNDGNGDIVEEPVSTIDLTDGSAFPTTATVVLLNYGKERHRVETQLRGDHEVLSPLGDSLLAVLEPVDDPMEPPLDLEFRLFGPGDTSLSVRDARSFPQAAGDLPFRIVINPGAFNEEKADVSAVDASTQTLTLSSGLARSHYTNERIVYDPGDESEPTYASRSGNTLTFAEAIYPGVHEKGEGIWVSKEFSIPDEFGFDQPILMPPDFGVRLQDIFDMIRAAGVQVTIRRDR